MKHPLKDTVTVLILTYNRYEHLDRLITYYLSHDDLPSLLILDSSSDEIPQSLKGKLATHGIERLKFSSDVFFTEKVPIGLSQVGTRFTALCAEDDFVTVSGLRSGIGFLSENDGFSCYMGKSISHGIYEDGSFFCGPLFGNACGNYGSSPLERVEFHFENPVVMNLYGLFFRQDHLRIWRETARAVSDWGLSETIPCCLSSLMGKIHLGSAFYWSNERNFTSPFDIGRTKLMYDEEKLSVAASVLADAFAEECGFKDRDEAKFFFRNELEQVAIETCDKLGASKTRKPSRKNSVKTNLLKNKTLRNVKCFVREKSLLKPFGIEAKEIATIKSLVTRYGLSQDSLSRTRNEYAGQGKANA